MGCNCGKNKRTAQQARAAQAATPQANQQSTTSQTQSAPKPTQGGSTQSFALKLNSGKTITFGSKLEAEAENVRQGYTGTVKPT